MKLEHKVFKSFLLTNQKLKLENYIGIPLYDEVILNVSNDYTYHYLQDEDKQIVLLGYCHDIRDSSLNEKDILQKLLIKESLGDVYDELDYLNGRYFIVYQNGSNLNLYSDATNLRPAFYNRKYKIIASHAYIIKEVMEQVYTENVSERKLFNNNAADWTMYEGIYKYNPSIEVSYENFTTKRIFPRNKRTEKAVDTIVREMDFYIENVNRWLSKQAVLKFSLTGGVDSRVSLAVLKPISKYIEYFTYLKSEDLYSSEYMERSYKNDERIVNDMVMNLNLNHEFFTIPNRKDVPKDFVDLLKETMSSTHSYALSNYISNRQDFKNALHIKSTVQSVGKSSFNTKLYSSNNLNNAMEGFKKWIPQQARKKEHYITYKNEMMNYLKRIKINPEELLGYHILDLIFLESRLGNFQSNITQETDHTLEIFNPFNSRKMIELFLAAPLDDRQEQTVAKQLIKTYWPILSSFQLNNQLSPDMKLSKLSESLNEKDVKLFFKRHLCLAYDIKNLTLYREGNEYYLEPSDVPIIPSKEYSIKFINFDKNHVNLNLKSVYNNEKGRGVITVTVEGIERDILDMQKGVSKRLDFDNPLELNLKVLKRKENASWKRAGRLALHVSRD